MSTGNHATIQMTLTGARQVISNLQATSNAVRGLGLAQKQQGISALTASERQWLHNQALFTLRRYAYAGTLALTALAAETVHWGYQFNQTMASSRTALLPVFGSVKAVNAELGYLYNFTKYTPFQFKDMTVAWRQMYGAFHPLGIGVQETNLTLKSIVDSLSYVGRTSPGALNRVAVALQHMAFMGRLTGMTVMQLARDGLPAFAVLNKEFGVTGDQLHHISEMGISTADFLKALNHYIQTTPGYMNAARRQAMTLGGMFTTLKDNVQQAMGALTLGSYNRGPSFIANINRTFDQVGNIIQRNNAAGRGMSITWKQLTDIFVRRYPALRIFVSGINLLVLYMKALWAITKNAFIPAVMTAFTVLSPLLLILVAFGKILKFAGDHAFVLRVLFTYLIASWAAGRLVLIGLSFWTSVMNGYWALMRLRLMAVTMWQNRLNFAQLMGGVRAKNLSIATAIQLVLLGKLRNVVYGLRDAWSILTTGIVQSRTKQTFVLSRLQRSMLLLRKAYLGAGGGVLGFAAALRVATAAMLTFFLSNPVGWIILAITAFGLLYWKVKAFRDIVNSVFTYIWHRIFYIMPELYLLKLAFQHIGDVIHWVGDQFARAWHYAKKLADIGNWIWKHIPGHHLLGLAAGATARGISAGVSGFASRANKVPEWGFASGGVAPWSGSFMVGERGPEMVTLPMGSRVTPNGELNWTLIVPAVFQIDGRKIADAAAKYRLEVAGRR